MIRLLDYSKTNKHLKIQQTFSSKQYPIYYSYQPQSLETNLTKVISRESRESDVIACYKHHIQTNVLPFLQRRRDFKSASVLSIPGEDGEVVVKINQVEKDRKINEIRQKMEEIIKVIDAYNLLKERGNLNEEIVSIDKFLSSLSIKDENLSSLVREVRELMQQNLPYLQLQQPNQQQRQEVVDKLQQIRKSNKYSNQPLDNIIKNIQELKNKDTKIDYQQLKQNQKNKLTHNIKKFQKYLYSKAEYLKQLKQAQHEEAETKMDVYYGRLINYQQQLEEEQKRVYEADTIYITKKFIHGVTLRQMILKKDERLTSQFCFDLSRAIVDFLFLHGGIKDLFITTENIIVQDSGAFHLNYFSFVGLQFVKLRKYVNRAEFQEILPYIHSKYIYENEGREMDIEVMLRFIVINFISALFKKDVLFDPNYIDFDAAVDPSSVREQIQNIQKKFFPKILSNDERQKIKEFDSTYKVNYSELVQWLFNRDSKYVKPALTWQFILSSMSRSTDGSYCAFHSQSPTHKGAINILQVNDNYNLKQKDMLDLFYLINVSIMEAVEHYTNIISHVVKDERFQKEMRPKNKEKVERIAGKLIMDQQEYQKRGWYNQEMFIPVKMQMSFTQILGHSSWTQMLYNERQPHIQTLKGVQNLFSFLLETEEILILIEPFLTEQIIKQALKEEKCTYYQKIPNKSYYSNLHSHKTKPKKYDENQVNIEEQQQQDNKANNFQLSSHQEQDTEQSFKQFFWRCFFTTFKIIYTLIKKYYIQIHEIDINGRIAINGDKYARLLEEFRPQIPPMTTQK